MNSQDFAGQLRVKIRDYEDEIGRLTARVDALLAEISELQSLRNSAMILLQDESGSRRNANDGPLTLSEKISVLSLSEAIAEIVNSSQGPIHADQVLKKLREAGRSPRAKNPKNSVVSLLHRGVKSGLYKKVGPNLFASIRLTEQAT
jgi:hypothetical protein